MSVARHSQLSPLQRLLQGAPGLWIVLAVVAGASYGFVQSPRSLPLRLLLIFSLLLIYFMPQKGWIKLLYGGGCC